MYVLTNANKAKDLKATNQIAVTVCGLVRFFPCYTNITVASNFLGNDVAIKGYKVLTSMG